MPSFWQNLRSFADRKFRELVPLIAFGQDHGSQIWERSKLMDSWQEDIQKVKK